MAIKSTHLYPLRREASIAGFAAFFQHLARALFHRYRPELHYMRGPGPRWHAKHDPR